MTGFCNININYFPPIMHSLFQFRKIAFNLETFKKLLLKKEFCKLWNRNCELQGSIF